MQAMHGEPGPRGHPTQSELDSWGPFGTGKGRLHIRSLGQETSEDLQGILDPAASFAEYGPENYGLLPGESRTENGSTAIGRALRDLPVTADPHQDYNATAERLTGPIQFVLKLLELWCLERNDAVALLGFDQSDAGHVAAILDGREQLRGRDVRDRISHLYSIRKTLRSLFQDMEVENAWLRDPHELLDGKAPISLLLGGSMEDLLLAREYVDAVAGH